MKKTTAQKWIYTHARTQLPAMLLLMLCNAVYAVLGVGLALFSKRVIDAAQARDKTALFTAAAIMLGAILLQILVRIAIRTTEVHIGGKLEMHLRNDLFTKILKSEYARITEFHSGELLTRLTADVTVVSDGVTTLLPTVVSLLTRLICAFAVLLSLDRTFSLIFAAAGLLLFLLTRLFRGAIKRLHKRVQETDGKSRAFMQEAIENLPVIQIFGVSEKMRDRSEVLLEDNFREKLRRNRFSVLANTGFSAALSFGHLFALVWGGVKICADALSFGTLTAVLQLVNQIQMPFTGLSGVVPKYYGMLASAERLMELENTEKDTSAAEKPDIGALYNALSAIELRDITFRYAQDTVLEHADATIRKNDFVLISGISGIGKSTLFKLLTGLLPPESGEIRLQTENGTVLPEKNSRGLFAYVPQGNMLFSGSLRDNIRFVREDATDEEILHAAEICCAREFIEALPEGLDTVIREKGQGLSEGQVQRIAVARAVLTNAPIILLDEATSALDEETERKLLQNLKEMQNKTCILISHKPASRAVCNKEICIENKKILEKQLS